MYASLCGYKYVYIQNAKYGTYTPIFDLLFVTMVDIVNRTYWKIIRVKVNLLLSIFFINSNFDFEFSN